MIKPKENGAEIKNMICARCGKVFSEREGHECES